MLTHMHQISNKSDLPFYCRPVQLFVAVWAMMLVSFELKISYTSYPDIAPALLLFGFSLAFFMLGYATLRTAYSAVGYSPVGPTRYVIDVSRLRLFHAACLFVTIAVMIFNWKKFGPPPVFGFFGMETFNYGEYGSLKQLLFPCFMSLFITAPLEPSRLRRYLLYIAGPLCSLAYASRGYTLIMMVQFLNVFSLRTKLSKRTIYLIAAGTFCLALFLSDVVGNSRSSYGSSALLGYMQIKRSYYSWPTAFLWLISYVSSPISNMCWIIHTYHYDHPSTAFLASLLPASRDVQSLEATDLGTSNIVDGVHTYLAKYYLDFWWVGIAGINYIWGLIAAYLESGNRLTRNYLTSSVVLGCLAFIFFADFISFLAILLQLAILGFGQRTFIVRAVDSRSGELSTSTVVSI